jgi:Flp pilus assembly protein TadG
MKLRSFTRRLLKDERGQMLPMMALLLVGMIGTAAMSIDLGRAFVSYRALQASTNAAALAGAQSLPNSTVATAASTYSAVKGDLNANANLSQVTMVSGYPKLLCLTTLSNMGMSCVAPANANAVQVKQQTTVPMLFAPIFGKTSLTLTATSTAAMRGSGLTPYNVAIIVDTTASMGDTDNDSQCKTTRLACSLAGVQTFLHQLAPCLSDETTCGAATNGVVANPVDQVSLFTFPNVTTATVQDDYACTGTNPTVEKYTFPTPGATSYSAMGSPATTYQIVKFASDYRTSDTASTLNSASDVVMAVGGKSACPSMSDPGGAGTYYAGAIYAAQAALVAEQTAYPKSQNVMILISDGDAGTTSADLPGASTTSGVYPSTVNQCHQAITAAQAAATAGTKVYAVAYGAESSGCSSDSPAITPCQTMQDIASTPQYFFSDYGQSGSGVDTTCISAAQPTSNLNQIFTDIAGDLTVARLIPNGTT